MAVELLDANDGHGFSSRDLQALEHRGWQNWFVLLLILLVSTGGLAVTCLSLLRGEVRVPWPWEGSERLLLGGLSLMVLLLGIYLTHQQRHLQILRARLLSAQMGSVTRVRRHNERLKALHRLSRAMAFETQLQSGFDCITRICFEAFDCEHVSLMLQDPKTGGLVVRSAQGERSKNLVGRRCRPGEGIAGWVAERKEPLILGAAIEENRFPGYTARETAPTAAMVVPILVRDELVGVVNVSSRGPDVEYDQEDLEALQIFAWNAGICIRHSEQRDWMLRIIKDGQRGNEKLKEA